MEQPTDQSTQTAQTLIADMEQTINRLKQISAEHNRIPMSMENSAARKRLYDQFDEEKARFYMAYGQDKSFRLEALHKELFWSLTNTSLIMLAPFEYSIKPLRLWSIFLHLRPMVSAESKL